jgi:transglutaminase-like putative cysteine protease
MTTAGIDRYQANNFLNWRPETAEFIRNTYTPTTVGYVAGTLPELEKLAGECTRGLRTNAEKAEAILMGPGKTLKHPFVPQIGERVKGDRDLDEQDLLENGTAWCNEQARVFVRLCQTQNIPARLIHLFYSNPPIGHTIAEFYDGSGWCLVDASYFIVLRDKDGRPLSAADCHDRGPGQARAGELWFAAISALVAEASRGQGEEPDARLVAWLKNQEGKSAETCSAELDFFGAMNYPLPGR